MNRKQQSEILLQFVGGLAIIWNTMIIIVSPIYIITAMWIYLIRSALYW